MQRDLTEKEWSLIESIRNFKNAKHNPSQQLEYFVIREFEELLYEEN